MYGMSFEKIMFPATIKYTFIRPQVVLSLFVITIGKKINPIPFELAFNLILQVSSQWRKVVTVGS